MQDFLTENLVGKMTSDYQNDANIPDGLKANLTNTVTVPDGTEIYFITFTDAEGANALTVQATDRAEAVCIKTYDVVAAETPCQSISVSYFPSPYDPSDEVVISIQPGDFGDFNGEFQFSSTGNGTFYLANENGPGDNSTETFSIAESAAGVAYAGGSEGDEITIQAVNATPALLNGSDCQYKLSESPEGVGCLDLDIVKPAGKWTEDDFTQYDEDDNEATQKFRIEVETYPQDGFALNYRYKWEADEEDDKWDDQVTDSDDNNPLINYLRDFDPREEPEVTVWAIDENGDKVKRVDSDGEIIPNEYCEDTVKLDMDDEPSDKPEIEKTVYDPDGKEWEDDTINIGGRDGNWNSGKYKHVTYLAIFEPGDEDNAELWEAMLENGKIQSELGSAGGNLAFEGMIIAVEGNGNKDYIIYKDDSFEINKMDNEDDILDKELEDFDSDYNRIDEDTDVDDFQDLDNVELEKYYDCDSDDLISGRVCIEDHDDTALNFQDGEKIEFKNLDKAKRIYVFYQMKNLSNVTDNFCRDMIEKYDMCGEEFINEINFEAGDEEGDDEAKVVVICPYILAREGGDVFFHSAVDTGIDVSACYEVETCEGPCIKPTPEPPQELEDTGIPLDEDGNPIVILASPTHDICKLSNTGELELEGYKDFISTAISTNFSTRFRMRKNP